MSSWLLVDGQYLAHRAKHSTGDLSHEGIATGVAFGVLRDLESLAERFIPDRIVLAFDHGGPGLRRSILPSYKSGRESRKTEEDRERDAIFYPELDRLRTKILPDLGYKNILEIEGYEADDIIAGYVEKLPKGGDAVIVSADKDLWQLLNTNVVCYNPASGKVLTKEVFREEWGINPEQWALVKALAGCGTDDVPGIDGIGDKTAAAWFAGKLKPGKKYDAITSQLGIIPVNLPLVKLPFPGLILPRLAADELTEGKKLAVLESLGIRRRRGGPARVAVEKEYLF